jgi:alpha-tubulin suppressor-like RCC1 family protein
VVNTPEDPTREGYTFLGWDQEIPENIPDNDVALTALWEAIKYDLTIQVYSSEYIINYTSNFILTDDGKVYAYGYLNDENWTGFYFDGIIPNGKVSRYIDVTPAFKLSAEDQIIIIGEGIGGYYALTQSGKIYVWGWNQYGQLGSGDINFLESPIEITQNFNFNNEEKIVDIKLGYTSIAMTDSNRVFIWGRDLYGIIPNGKVENESIPVDITDYFNLNQNEILLDVNLAEHHAIAYTNQNRIFTWGYNQYGQLGNNTLENSSTPIDISSWISLDSEESIKFVRAGYYSSAFITTKNRIFTWGTPAYYVLANGYAYGAPIKIPQDNTNYFELQPNDSIIKFQFGYQSLILTEQGNLYTWGYNSSGSLLGHSKELKFSMPNNITPTFNLLENEVILYANIDTSGFAITNFNNVYTWGPLIGGFYNSSEINYQAIKINEIISLTENEKVIKITGNGSKVMLLTNEGRLQGLGNDYDGFFASNNESLKFSSVFIQMFAWSKDEIVFRLEYESEIFQLEFIANFKNDITWVSDFNTRSSFEFFNMPKYDITLIGIKN